VRTSVGERVRADSSVGADPILRFLALLEATPLSDLPPERRLARAAGSIPPPGSPARERLSSSVGTRA
jgi:hypothetical protein